MKPVKSSNATKSLDTLYARNDENQRIVDGFTRRIPGIEFREIVDGFANRITASGTSEGVKKSWDKRHQWGHINTALMNTGHSPSKIADVLSALPKDEKIGLKEGHSWDSLNKALMKTGHSPSHIADILIHLNKTEKGSK